MFGRFKAWNPFLLGGLLLAAAALLFFADAPLRSRAGWIEAWQKNLAALVMAAGGAWSIIRAAHGR